MQEKDKLINNILAKQLDPDYEGALLAIDGQWDTPGHSASHCALGVYDLGQGMHELQSLTFRPVGKVIKTVNVQRAETGFSSPGMEKEGIRRALTELIARGMKIKIVVMDRSPANKKLLREEFPDIEVQHDSWHAVKKVRTFDVSILEHVDYRCVPRDGQGEEERAHSPLDDESQESHVAHLPAGRRRQCAGGRAVQDYARGAPARPPRQLQAWPDRRGFYIVRTLFII